MLNKLLQWYFKNYELNPKLKTNQIKLKNQLTFLCKLLRPSKIRHQTNLTVWIYSRLLDNCP